MDGNPFTCCCSLAGRLTNTAACWVLPNNRLCCCVRLPMQARKTPVRGKVAAEAAAPAAEEGAPAGEGAGAGAEAQRFTCPWCLQRVIA